MVDKMARRLLIGAALFLSLVGAAAQSATTAVGADANAATLTIEDVVVRDDVIEKKGIAGAPLAGALRFFLGADPSISVPTQEAPAGKKPTKGYNLTSALQAFQDSVLWTGTLEYYEEGAPPRSPARLGPVTLADGGGLRPTAVNEIVALVRRQLQQGVARTQNLIGYRIGCFSTGPPNTNDTRRLAGELPLDLDSELQSLGTLQGGGVFDCSQPTLSGPGAAVIRGSVADGNPGTVVQAQLLWTPERQGSVIFVLLPEFREAKITQETRQRYVRPFSPNQ